MITSKGGKTKRIINNETTKIKDRVMFNNFTYNLSKEQKEFIKSKKTQQDLAIKYSMYQLYRKSKGFEANISYNTFSKIYAKSKKCNKFSDLEWYTNDLSREEIYNSLVVYLEYLRETLKKYENVEFKNSINPKQRIIVKFLGNDILTLDFVSNFEEIKTFNSELELVIGKEYSFYEFIYNILRYHFYPSEDEIWKDCRTVNGDYYDACTILYDTRENTYILG